MAPLGVKHYAVTLLGVAFGAVSTHKLYGDYPLFGVNLHLPADLEGDPKAGKPVFRIRPRSEIMEHAARYKLDDQINFDELQKNIKEWADEQDKLNSRGPDEVWAKIEKYGWMATLSHRVGLKKLEDVNVYDDQDENQSKESESSTNDIDLSRTLNASENSDVSDTAYKVTHDIFVEERDENKSNLLVDESLRTPDVVKQGNVT